MHSDARVDNEVMFGGVRTAFTRGGVNKFEEYKDDVEVEKK